jgi:hypothetical protein
MVERLQIAFLTGRSNPRSCALSPEQAAFLAQLAAPRRTLLPCNFPYAAHTPHATTPLWRASLNNLREYRAARRAAFAVEHRPAVLAMLARAPHTVLLVGSCGLHLLAGLRLDPAALRRISVFAYGAVAQARPACRTLLVQGRRDWLSRGWSPAADHRVAAGHLDYLRNAQVLTLCLEFVAAIERDTP